MQINKTPQSADTRCLFKWLSVHSNWPVLALHNQSLSWSTPQAPIIAFSYAQLTL